MVSALATACAGRRVRRRRRRVGRGQPGHGRRRSALDVGFSGFSRNSPVLTLLLSLGPVLVPALPGVLGARTETARRPSFWPASGIAVGLFLLYFVRISEASWVGFRAGQILLVSIPILLARTLEWLPRHSAGASLAGVIVIIGLPTTVIDAWNAQDIGNRRPGPGFRWTLWTTPAQQQAFRVDARRHAAEERSCRWSRWCAGREHWTLIPSFAGRRMAAGLPISLLPLPDYPERSEQVEAVFETADAGEASALAQRLRIDYLYVDQDDLAAYPPGTAKFDANPRHFERVFAQRHGAGVSASSENDQPVPEAEERAHAVNQSRQPIFLPSSRLRG